MFLYWKVTDITLFHRTVNSGPLLTNVALQECVPVILSDEIELPFQNVLDYSEFTIKWPSTHINEGLLEYLRLIPGAYLSSICACLDPPTFYSGSSGFVSPSLIVFYN